MKFEMQILLICGTLDWMKRALLYQINGKMSIALYIFQDRQHIDLRSGSGNPSLRSPTVEAVKWLIRLRDHESSRKLQVRNVQLTL